MEPMTSSSADLFGHKAVTHHKLIIYREAVRLGEWPVDDVRALVAEGLLQLSDYYWRQGMKEWAPLSGLLSQRRKQNLFSNEV